MQVMAELISTMYMVLLTAMIMLHRVHGNYHCVCNYNAEKDVYIEVSVYRLFTYSLPTITVAFLCKTRKFTFQIKTENEDSCYTLTNRSRQERRLKLCISQRAILNEYNVYIKECDDKLLAKLVSTIVLHNRIKYLTINES